MTSAQKLATGLLLVGTLALVVLVGTATPARADDGESPLERSMQLLEFHYLNLRMQASAGNLGEASLDAVCGMQTAALEAKVLVPAAAAKLEEGERAKFVRAYRGGMVVLIQKLLALELLLCDGDLETAATAVEGITIHMRRSHDTFQ